MEIELLNFLHRDKIMTTSPLSYVKTHLLNWNLSIWPFFVLALSTFLDDPAWLIMIALGEPFSHPLVSLKSRPWLKGMDRVKYFMAHVITEYG
jgi:hypothetical protein